MLTAERSQRDIVEGLHADRDAGDPGGAVAGEVAAFGTGGIGLERDLGIGCDLPKTGDCLDDGTHRSRRHQGGGAAAEKDAGDTARSGLAAKPGQLTDERGGEGGGVDRRMTDMGIEVAIGAFGAAERPVDIDTEAWPRRASWCVGRADALAQAGKGASAMGHGMLVVRRHLAEGQRLASGSNIRS